MAQRSGLSPSSIGRIWRAFDLKPHRAGGFKCESLRLVTVTEPRTHEDISPVASGQL
jgi:hypothetical protein